MIWTFRIFCTLLFALCVQSHVAAHKVKNHPPSGSRVLAEKVHPKKVSDNNKKGKYLLVEIPDEHLKKVLGLSENTERRGYSSEESSEEKTDIHIVPGSLVPMRPPNHKPYPIPYPHPRPFSPLLLRRIIMQWLRRQKMRLQKPIARHGRKPMIAWKPMVVYGGPNHLHQPWGPPMPGSWGKPKKNNPVAWGPPQPRNIETSAFDAPDMSDYLDDYEQEDKPSAQKGQKTQLKELSSEDLTTDDISFEEEIPDDISFEDLELPDDTSFEEEMPVSYEQVEDNLIVDRGDNYKGEIEEEQANEETFMSDYEQGEMGEDANEETFMSESYEYFE